MNTDLAWPPPGLDALHGKARQVSGRARTATTLLAIVIAWHVFALPVDHRAVRTLIGLTLVASLICYLGAIMRAAALLDTARRARRLGYRRGILAYVALDRHTDSRELFAGEASFESVRLRTRDRIRSLRLLSSVLLLLAVLLPPPLAGLSLMLAMRGSASDLAAALIVLAPPLFCAVVAVVAHGYAAVLAQWDRGGDAWDPAPVTTEERARTWIEKEAAESNDAHTSVVPAARAASGGLLVTILGAGAGIALFLFVAASIGAVLGFVSVTHARLGSADYSIPQRTIFRIEIMRPWRLPADSSIDPMRAGNALHTLLFPTGSVPDGIQQPERSYDAPVWPRRVPPLNSAELYFRIVQGDTSLMNHAALSDAVAAIRAYRPHPVFAELTVLARAPDIDVTATRFIAPVDPAAVEAMYNRRALAHAAMIVAAQRLQRGDADGAELIMREILSAGFLLIDRSPYQSDFWLGIDLIENATEALTYIYGRTGRTELANVLRRLASMQPTNAYTGQATGDYGPLSGPRNGTDAVRARIAPLMGAAFTYPALRWRGYQVASHMARCGSFRSVLFGPSERHTRSLGRLLADLPRLPSDTALVRLATEPDYRTQPEEDDFRYSRRPGFRRLQRIVVGILGEENVAGPCITAVTSRF